MTVSSVPFHELPFHELPFHDFFSTEHALPKYHKVMSEDYEMSDLNDPNDQLAEEERLRHEIRMDRIRAERETLSAQDRAESSRRLREVESAITIHRTKMCLLYFVGFVIVGAGALLSMYIVKYGQSGDTAPELP